MKEYEAYVDDFLKGVSYTENEQCENLASSENNDIGVELYRKAAKLIYKYYPERIGVFAKMLKDSNVNVRVCCAVCMLEEMDNQLTQEQEKDALKTIQDRIDNGSPLERESWGLWKEKRNKKEAKEKKTFEGYVADFLKGVSYTENVQYENSASVRKNNKGVLLYRKSAKLICKYYPERVSDFAKMLNNPNVNVRVCCAVCLLEEMDNLTKEQEKESLAIIQDRIDNGSPLEKTGWELWKKMRDKKEKTEEVS